MFSLVFRTIYIIFPIIWEYLLFIPRHIFVMSSTLSSNEMLKFAETMPNIKKNIPHNLFCSIEMFINLNKCLTVFSDYSAQFISFFPIIWEYLPFIPHYLSHFIQIGTERQQKWQLPSTLTEMILTDWPSKLAASQR